MSGDADLAYLSGAAMVLAELPPDNDVFDVVAQHLVELAPDTLVTVSSYDPAERATIVRAVDGSE